MKPRGEPTGERRPLPSDWGGLADLEALRAAQGDPGGTVEDVSWADLGSADLLNLSFWTGVQSTGLWWTQRNSM
jgi:hypothetical protein